MPHDPKKLLEDIRLAASAIVDFTSSESESSFVSNLLIRSAVERQFIIIGEAIRNLARADAAQANLISNGNRILSFRNILVHGYDVIDPVLVWQTVQGHLPILFREVETLLASQP